MAKVEYIFVHCSDSEFGTAMEINKWHIEKGWKEIGYHAVIQNGKPTYEHYKQNIINTVLDGQIENGRELNPNGNLDSDEVGAQVQGWNNKSIGVCLIGKKDFTSKQLFSLLRLLKLNWMPKFNIGIDRVWGHYEASNDKTCPNINMVNFRNLLKDPKIDKIFKINDWANNLKNRYFDKILYNYGIKI